MGSSFILQNYVYQVWIWERPYQKFSGGSWHEEPEWPFIASSVSFLNSSSRIAPHFLLSVIGQDLMMRLWQMTLERPLLFFPFFIRSICLIAVVFSVHYWMKAHFCSQVCLALNNCIQMLKLFAEVRRDGASDWSSSGRSNVESSAKRCWLRRDFRGIMGHNMSCLWHSHWQLIVFPLGSQLFFFVFCGGVARPWQKQDAVV